MTLIDPSTLPALAQALRDVAAHLDEIARGGLHRYPPPCPQYVTLDQCGAMVHRSKRTFYHYPGRPDPVVRGGHGRFALYDWARMRPWLLSVFGVPLPETFPGY